MMREADERSALDGLREAARRPPPWLSPYLPAVCRVVDSGHATCVHEALNAARTGEVGVRFVAQSLLPADEAYESFIFRTGGVPTRDNPHDLFNGLVWLSYPQTKRRLNQLQAEQIARHGTAGPRGPLRDALTVFDENAAVLQAPAALVEALRLRDWDTLFVGRREQWAAARLQVFGHALLEKLAQPRKAITAHVWRVEECSDGGIAASLDPVRLAAKDFLPLPVLGVPGWWAANEDSAFYDDAGVFRPLR